MINLIIYILKQSIINFYILLLLLLVLAHVLSIGVLIHSCISFLLVGLIFVVGSFLLLRYLFYLLHWFLLLLVVIQIFILFQKFLHFLISVGSRSLRGKARNENGEENISVTKNRDGVGEEIEEREWRAGLRPLVLSP